MSRLTFSTHRNYLVVPAAFLVSLVLVQQIFAVPENTILVPANNNVLGTYNDSLTTYKPSSKSGIQDIRALIDQRGVNFDGTLRLGSTHRMALAGNPFGQSWNRNQMLSGVRLNTGTFIISDVDLGFPAQVPWLIGRSYNSRQKDSGGSYFASTGYQGRNWFQSSQPELVFFDSATDSEDLIYLIYGADRFIALSRVDVEGTPSTTTFKAVNGAAGAILLHTFDGIDLATYYDQNGNRFDFFWFGDDDTDDDIEGSIWRIMDPTIEVDPYDAQDRLVSTDGNVAYVGDIGNPNTALSSGYDAATGAITTAYDSAGRRFTSTYTSSMLTQVKAEVNSGGWTEVGKVDYSYYVNAQAHGEDDDLRLVTITMPLTDSGVSQVRKKLYWYYEGTYDATTNPGYHHQIQYLIDFEGYRKYDWDQDSNLDDDPLSATEANLQPYASAYFEYDTEHRIVEAWFNGACGCSGAASGTHIFEYESNGSYSDGAGYDEDEWMSRTIVRKPDVTYKTSSGAIKSYITQYFDETGQPLDRVLTDDDPDNTDPAPSVWATKIDRDSNGQVVAIHSPANVTGYTHSTAAFTTSTTAGLVRTFARVSSGTLARFLDDAKHKTGTSGSAYLDSNPEYLTTDRILTVGDVGVTRPFILSRRVYTQAITSGTTGSHLTSFSYDWHSATATDVLFLAPKKVTQTNPAVSTGNNGSGSSTTVKRYLRKDGTTAFVESATGIFTYSQFTDGQLTKRIDDVKTNGTFPSGDDPNTDWGITETGNGSDRTTTFAFDSQGRRDIVTQPDGRVLKTYYSKLADGRSATLGYNDYEDLATDKYHGPVRYTVTNHAGKAEVTATVELSGNESTLALTDHVDEAASDPILAVETTTNKLGDLARMTASVFDETGTTLEESRPYFLIPATGSGTEGTNYDATFFGYDDQGRRYRTKAPTGTINRADFDTLGRTVRQWIGDNDNAFNGGESSGTDTMVKTSENVYDSGNDKGNSYLTKRTAFVEDSDIEDDGDMVEWVKYSSYGVPFGLPKGDQDSDGDLDGADVVAIVHWGGNPYDVRADLDLDGDVDSTDATLASNASPITLGWGKLSPDPDSGVGNRKGYAGYEFDSALSGAASVYHVRNRVLHARLGRWTRRDPLGYVDGANLYQYVSSNPLAGADPQGTVQCPNCPTPPGGCSKTCLACSVEIISMECRGDCCDEYPLLCVLPVLLSHACPDGTLNCTNTCPDGCRCAGGDLVIAHEYFGETIGLSVECGDNCWVTVWFRARFVLRIWQGGECYGVNIAARRSSFFPK